ncbi:transcriptional regulatory moc3 [Fusarium napiforme]|uniref:Transcriptional regulatory moc3 n=1 Tax=Fusarium napiforme TaxID=42672 RepID=A0A8H5JZE9_9HYPO|nr:transcriptional regulatory moc3 [Fusarium napiforme]
MELPTVPTPSSVAEYVISVLQASENTPYIGEPISQLQHSLQCAAQAASASPPVDEATQIAALLHDVGQYAPVKDLRKLTGGEARNLGGQATGTSVGRVGHETLGAQFVLALGFSPKVARLVESHVAAKRYLCAVDKGYLNKLSDASKKSLAYQGGPMSDDERDEFGADEWCKEMCQLRVWDDEAKIEGLEISPAMCTSPLSQSNTHMVIGQISFRARVFRQTASADNSPPGQASPLHFEGISPGLEPHETNQSHSSPTLTDGYENQGSSKVLSTERTNQTPFLYEGRTNVDVTACLQKALQCRSTVPIAEDNYGRDESPLNLISRDIELTTTLDILTLRTQSPYMTELFLDTVECPGITPFDPLNWKLAKENIVHLGKSCLAISSGITAVATLCSGHVFALSTSESLSRYHSARKNIEELLEDDEKDFDLALVAVFLLCMFELIHSGDITPYLRVPSRIFIPRLQAWVQTQTSYSELSTRIVTWFKILYSASFRGGAMGLLSERVFSLLPDFNGPIPNLRPPGGQEPEISNHLYEVLSAPIFDFYCQLQKLSGEIAKLSLYHRSRTKRKDQQEVVERMATLKTRLRALWEIRCATQRQSSEQLRAQIVPRIADMISSLISICEAAYHAEFIDIGRQLGDPVSQSPDSIEALDRIREIVERDRSSDDEGRSRTINPGYLRPLFLCAIDSTDKEQTYWAIENLAKIQNRVYRAEFFSAFAKALSEAQTRNDRRVTSRYFCIWYFGITPPFL